MLKVVFKNMDRSDLTQTLIDERIRFIERSFPDLKSHRIIVTLEKLGNKFSEKKKKFGVRFFVNGKKFHNLVLEKKASNFYQAMNELGDSLQERLHRYCDKNHFKQHHQIVYH